MSELAMIIKTRTQSGRREDIKALYAELMAPRAEANDHQKVVVWCDDQHDPDVFYLFEVYSDASAMGENASAPWFGEYMAKVGPMLADKPEVVMATPTWSKGI